MLQLNKVVAVPVTYQIWVCNPVSPTLFNVERGTLNNDEGEKNYI